MQFHYIPPLYCVSDNYTILCYAMRQLCLLAFNSGYSEHMKVGWPEFNNHFIFSPLQLSV